MDERKEVPERKDLDFPTPLKGGGTRVGAKPISIRHGSDGRLSAIQPQCNSRTEAAM